MASPTIPGKAIPDSSEGCPARTDLNLKTGCNRMLGDKNWGWKDALALSYNLSLHPLKLNPIKLYGIAGTKHGREEGGASPRPHASFRSLEQMNVTHTCTRAHPRRRLGAGDRRAGPLEGRSRGSGPTHHERRGAQRSAAGSSMPQRAEPAPAGPRAAAPGAALRWRRRQYAQSRAEAA